MMQNMNTTNTDELIKRTERSILQCIIENGAEVFREANARSDDFKIRSHKRIFEAMLSLETEGLRPNDIVLLHNRLDGLSFEALNLMTNGDMFGMFSPEMIKQYVKDLRELNKKSIVSEVINEHGNIDPSLIGQKISERIDALAEKTEEDDTKILADVYKELEELYESDTKILGLSFGYGGLDHKLYGLKKGELYIIAARPSIGKSMFVLNIAYSIAKAGGHVLINALEETKKNIYKRLISHITQINIHKIMTGDLEEQDWATVLDASEKIKSISLTIIDDAGLTGAQIARNIARTHSRKPIDLVIVDHLQEVSDRANTRHQAISEALATMKNTTKKLDIPFICVSQINRQVEMRKPPRPIMSDLKESGDIEQKADAILMLYREGYYKPDTGNDIEVIIAKARNGMCGIVSLDFDGATMSIKERY
jgi:replicative DNA helicase